jgi:DNA-binding NarL/FixJ family response regulator
VLIMGRRLSPDQSRKIVRSTACPPDEVLAKDRTRKVSSEALVDKKEFRWHYLGMTTRTAVIVERKGSRATRTAVQRAVLYLRTVGYETSEFESVEASGRVGPKFPADVVLLSTGSGKTSRLVAEVKHLREAFPNACVLVTTDTFSTAAVAEVYSAGAAVVAPPRAFLDAVRNVTVRDAVTTSDSVRVRVAGETSRHPIEDQIVDDFHDRQTGRLDAARVAQAYGVSLSALARALNVTQSALSKRPTASAAQPALRELEFAWAALIDAVEAPERVRAWLNARRPDLSGKPPIVLLLEGSAEAFANYVRSVVAGEPG